MNIPIPTILLIHGMVTRAKTSAFTCHFQSTQGGRCLLVIDPELESCSGGKCTYLNLRISDGRRLTCIHLYSVWIIDRSGDVLAIPKFYSTNIIWCPCHVQFVHFQVEYTVAAREGKRGWKQPTGSMAGTALDVDAKHYDGHPDWCSPQGMMCGGRRNYCGSVSNSPSQLQQWYDMVRHKRLQKGMCHQWFIYWSPFENM